MSDAFLPGFEVRPLVQPERTAGLTIQQKFEAFDAANPQVGQLLTSMARSMKSRGRTRIGIGMLYEVLRWNYYLNNSDPNSDFKLSNNYRSRYARKIMETHKDMDGFITTRELRTP